MSRFRHVLVANRGEIAVRVIRTAQGEGYGTTAVYSEADVQAPHVSLADQAYLLGPGPAAQSYLDFERILEAVRATGAQAVHPGYGFLSENAQFAQACADHGLVFIGPSVTAIELMGNKARAKDRMIEAGVPCVPGFQGEQDDATLLGAAEQIGYPIMIKAAAGGGGRGMRLVQDAAGLIDGLQLARAEAQNAFGSGELILEKAIMRSRHVEVQILADEHGTVLHLGERDCSVQRRHQKIIEEAPSPAIDSRTRDAMTTSAINAARAIGYHGVGTVEFIVAEDGTFYFIEMNTRLQVEHPVTEAITGIDLVAQQLHVAQGRPLTLRQTDIALNGHAIEARLYAEDPARGFLPSGGCIERWRAPSGIGIRCDAGIVENQAISMFYDPMLAKIIAHGADRDEALHRLRCALDRTVLLGPATNIAFLQACLAHKTFSAGGATTAFIAENFPEGITGESCPDAASIAIGAALLHRNEFERWLSDALGVGSPLHCWSSSRLEPITRDFIGDNGPIHVRMHWTNPTHATIAVGDERFHAELLGKSEGPASVSLNGRRFNVPFRIVSQHEIILHVEDRAFSLKYVDPQGVAEDDGGGDSIVRAPMHGAAIDVLVREGEAVVRGQRLIVLEAMKMQHELTSSIDAVVQHVHVRPGQQIAMGAVLLELCTALS